MTIPSLDIDFYSDAVIRDPYPVYAQMRDIGAVVYLPQHDLYALPRYAEVSDVLRQPMRFVSSRGVSPIAKVNDILVGSTLNSDPPDHDRTRAVTSEPLLPGALAEIEPMLKTAADGLIDTLCARREFDAIKDFARFLPVTIVAELVGLPVDPDQLLKWASATFNLFGAENARATQAFDDLVDLRDFLQEYGHPEKLKDGGWAQRIFQVGAERGLSQDTCAQLMRDYINPSLDTTISTTAQIVKFFADHPDQWAKIRKDASLIPNAVEEAVRMASPIRAFTRYVAHDSQIAVHTIPAGKRVIVMYASANRDPRKFADPDLYDVARDVHDHLGDGQGIHTCMGMHLARRQIILLLEALRRRVVRFELLAEPAVAMNNTIRSYANMPMRVHLADDVAAGATGAAPATETRQAPETPWLDVTLTVRKTVATDIIDLELRAANGTALPAYDAGAHVDVYVAQGLVRQYSLTGDPSDRSAYRLGILRDATSRGGSAAIHATFQQGDTIRIGRPRSGFPLRSGAAQTVFFAGGIGITPVLTMAYALEAAGACWHLHYCGRTADRMAYVDELARFGDKVHIHIDNGPDDQRLDIATALGHAAPDRHLYVCGPDGFMDYVVQSAKAQNWSTECIHLERFGAEVDTDGAPFTVVARASGKTFTVAPGETIAQTLEHNGIPITVSCQSGVCGTCLTGVVEGKPDHRDLVQTDAERASNRQITVCCSRSNTKTLVLDI